MERTRIIPSLYGYGVCLIAVVVFLVCIAGFVSSAFRTANPALGGYRPHVAVQGFRPHAAPWGGFMHHDFGHRGGFAQPVGFGHRPMYGSSGATQGAANAAAGGSPISGATPRSADLQNARIARGRLEAVRYLTINFVLIVVAVLLFLGHWRWLHGPQPA